MTLTSAMHIEAIKNVLSVHPGIDVAILFGSVARGNARLDSDLDIAVRSERPLGADEKMHLVGELALATGRAIDLIDLHVVGEPLLGQILKHGQCIVASSDRMVELMRRHVFDTEDFMPYVQRMLAERRNAWIG